MYKRIAEVRSDADIAAVLAELTDRYGQPPEEVVNLLEVAKFRLVARAAGVTEVVAAGNFIRFGPADLLDSKALRLKRLYPGSVIKETAKIILVPRPTTSRIGGQPVQNRDLLSWCESVVRDIFA
jgi:transcription-repair coupling factor (superfamily II helicase)